MQSYVDTHLSVIGEHFKKIINILKTTPQLIESIQSVLSLTTNETNVIEEIYKIMKILNEISPSDVDIMFVELNFVRVVTRIINLLKIKSYNYCHLLVHIVEDFGNYQTTSFFSGFSFESMNRTIKKIIKNHTNNQQRDTIQKRTTFSKQTIEKMIIQNQLNHILTF